VSGDRGCRLGAEVRQRVRRQRILPYLMAIHFALDASLPVLTLLVSTGALAFR
jgi:hypothetical protein